jgi:hypothetical protein
MEAIELLKEADQMIKELQDAYISHDGAAALRRKIRKFIAAQQSVKRTTGMLCHPYKLDALGSKSKSTRRG